MRPFTSTRAIVYEADLTRPPSSIEPISFSSSLKSHDKETLTTCHVYTFFLIHPSTCYCIQVKKPFEKKTKSASERTSLMRREWTRDEIPATSAMPGAEGVPSTYTATPAVVCAPTPEPSLSLNVHSRI